MQTVTVGIPVFNEDKYLANTIESVLKQTYIDIKVIISDNCSTDSSYDIVQKYASEDSRIEHIRHSKNIGATNNFKYTLDMCTTNYFMWLGAHDTLEKDFIRSATEILNNENNVVLTYPKSILIDVKGNIIDKFFYDDIDSSGLSLEKRLFKIATNLNNCFAIHGLFRANLLRKINLSNTKSADHTLLFCVSSHGDIRLIDSYGLRCRKVRDEEEANQTLQRLIDVGIDLNKDSLLPQHTPMVTEHLECIWKKEDILLITKLKLSVGIQKIFLTRFGVTWLAILSQNHQFFKYAYLFDRQIKFITARFRTLIKSILFKES